jgi:alpha-ketoglutarate-dependent taurine dioxygenase
MKTGSDQGHYVAKGDNLMDLWQQIKEKGYVYLETKGIGDPDQTLEESVASFARPISYVGLPMVMDLRPQPGFQPASYAGTGVFDLHTDLTWYENPPTYIAMYCVSMESAGGGLPLLADGWQALDDLDEADRHYLTTEPVTFPPPSHINYPPLTGPIVREQAGKLHVRFRYDLLDNPAPPVSRFFEAIKQRLIKLEVGPGSVFIFDNDRMLHGRTELKSGLTSDRFFKRMYAEALETN